MAFEFSRTNLPKKLFINNEYVAAKGTEKLSVYNPKDGALVADDVAVADKEDVEAAVVAAEKAFPAWKKTPPTKRRDILLKLASLIEQHSEVLSDLSRITLGAPRSTMGHFEIMIATEVILSPARFLSFAVRMDIPYIHSSSYGTLGLRNIGYQIQRWMGRQICR